MFDWTFPITNRHLLHEQLVVVLLGLTIEDHSPVCLNELEEADLELVKSVLFLTLKLIKKSSAKKTFRGKGREKF